jgi:hypothetical protein
MSRFEDCDIKECSEKDMERNKKAFDIFNTLRGVYRILENSTRSDPVQKLFSRLKKCIVKLFDEVKDEEYGHITILERKDNWYQDYNDLMVFVTGELNAAYKECGDAGSGGLSYKMYEMFVNLLNECRVWMGQNKVVLGDSQLEIADFESDDDAVDMTTLLQRMKELNSSIDFTR